MDPLTPDQFRRIREIFEGALQQPGADRRAWVEAACGGDSALRGQLERMLAAANQQHGLLDRSADGTGETATGPCPACAATVSPSRVFCPSCGTPNDPAFVLRETSFSAGALFAGRFQIVALQGRGGMGQVYRAYDLELAQPIALKFLSRLRSNPRARDRLRTEVRLARQIAHPHVCRVYDIGEADGELYLSMEYVDGEDLATLLKRAGRMPVRNALEIGRGICAGLAAAHARGVLHRDLKPGNIMIDTHGDVRIMDFGLAASAAEPVDAADVRSGTPAYMAPEQLEGREATLRSDIYALGLVLFELFTATQPFDGSSVADFLRLRSVPPSTAPSTLVPDLPPAIDRTILRCLEPDPTMRPRSALEVEGLLALKREDHGRRRSLAVLPFANLSRDGSHDFFAEGMTDELIGCLMNIEALRVASRTSVMAYRGVPKPLRQIARELDVDWIVEGAVIESGGRVRITAHLIEGATETQRWAEEYEKDLRDVLALQSAVARDIAREIRVTVTAPEQSRLAKSRSVDPESYDAYLRGRHFVNKRSHDDLKRAVDYFRTAIDKDPTYAPAYAGLADAYAMLGSVGYDVLPPREAMPRAKAAAVQALEIDETMAEAHASLGYVKLSYEWDWFGAEEQFKRAITCRASCASAHLWYGHCLFALQRLDEAAREMRRALELEPLSIPCNLGVGWSLYYERKYEEAVAQYRKTLEISPDLPMALYELGLCYQNMRRYDEALAAFQKGHEMSRGEAASVMLLAHLHALNGRYEDARRHLATLEAMATQTYVPSLYMAFVYVGYGDSDRAFAWFERAYQERSSYLIYLAVEPSLDVLRSDSRYAHLIRRLGLAPAN